MLIGAADAAAQRITLHARAGAAGSTSLVRDQVATPQIAELLDAAVDDEVRAAPKPGLTVGAGVHVGFWPRVALRADVELTPGELEAEDGAGTRPVQDLSVLQAVLGAQWAVRSSLELGAGAGMVWYLTDDRGLFSEGDDTSPLIEVNAAWTPSIWQSRVALQAAASTHRFGTPAIRAAGGSDGTVTRLSLTARVRLMEFGR